MTAPAGLLERLIGGAGVEGLSPQERKALKSEGLLNLGTSLLKNAYAPFPVALGEGLESVLAGGRDTVSRKQALVDIDFANSTPDEIVAKLFQAYQRAVQSGNKTVSKELLTVLQTVAPSVLGRAEAKAPTLQTEDTNREIIYTNPATGEIVQRVPKQPPFPTGSEGLTPFQRATLEERTIDNARGLAAAWERQVNPELNAYRSIRQAVQDIPKALSGSGGPEQLGVIYAYIRALEPGVMSVVREGEVAIARQAASLFDRWGRAVEGFYRGQPIPRGLVKEMGTFLEGRKKSIEEFVKEKRKGFVKQAEDFKIPEGWRENLFSAPGMDNMPLDSSIPADSSIPTFTPDLLTPSKPPVRKTPQQILNEVFEQTRGIK